MRDGSDIRQDLTQEPCLLAAAIEHLRRDRHEIRRQKPPDLLLPIAGKRMDDTGRHILRARRVQRPQHQMPRLRRRQRRRDRLTVSHLSQRDDIGILSQRITDALRKIHHITPDLPLMDERLLHRDHVLHRILQRHHMTGSLLADQRKNARHRRTLAASRRARDEDKPVRKLRYLLQPRPVGIRAKQRKLRQDADRRRCQTAAAIQMQTAADISQRKRTVRASCPLIRRLPILRHIGRDELCKELRLRDLLHFLQCPIDTDHKRQPLGQVNIRHGRVRCQQFLYIHLMPPRPE